MNGTAAESSPALLDAPLAYGAHRAVGIQTPPEVAYMNFMTDGAREDAVSRYWPKSTYIFMFLTCEE